MCLSPWPAALQQAAQAMAADEKPEPHHMAATWLLGRLPSVLGDGTPLISIGTAKPSGSSWSIEGPYLTVPFS